MELQLKDIVKAHQERKERLDALADEYETKLKELKKEISILEGAAHKILLEQGNQSVRTDFGTVFRQKWTKAKVTDMASLWEWATKNNRQDLFPKSVNKTVVLSEIERAKEETGEDYTGCPVPGVEIEEGYKCHIRKSPQ